MTLAVLLFAGPFEGEGFAGVFNSPFIVPVFGTIMILGIVVAGIWSGVRNREMQSQERLAAIAKGIPLEPAWDEALVRRATTQSPIAAAMQLRPNDGAGARRVGIVLVSVGVGLGAFFSTLAMILQERDVFCGAATGLIPLAIGAGFLVDANLRRAEFWRLSEAAHQQDPLSTSQISELRPLH